MNQANQTVNNFYEQAEFSNLDDFAFIGFAFHDFFVGSFFPCGSGFPCGSDTGFTVSQPFLMLLGFFRFQQIPAGNNDTFFLRIYFNDLSFQFFAHIRVKVIDMAEFNVGSRHKTFYAFHRNCQTYNLFRFVRIFIAVACFDDTQYLNGCRTLFPFRQFLNILPCSFFFSTDLGETDEIFRCGTTRYYNSLYFIPNLDRFHQFIRISVCSPVIPGDQTFTSIAKRNINAFFIYLNNFAGNEFAGMHAVIFHACIEHCFKFVTLCFVDFHVFHRHDSLLNYTTRSGCSGRNTNFPAPLEHFRRKFPGGFNLIAPGADGAYQLGQVPGVGTVPAAYHDKGIYLSSQFSRSILPLFGRQTDRPLHPVFTGPCSLQRLQYFLKFRQFKRGLDDDAIFGNKGHFANIFFRFYNNTIFSGKCQYAFYFRMIFFSDDNGQVTLFKCPFCLVLAHFYVWAGGI